MRSSSNRINNSSLLIPQIISRNHSTSFQDFRKEIFIFHFLVKT
nr:MAG TPA: hypothetical protein [Caudoviricetes sp.]